AQIFATVGEEVISTEEFLVNLQAGYRQRFYHGKVPAAERLAFRREVGDSLITRRLLRGEAQRRGLQPDGKWIDEQIKGAEARYRSLPHWEAQRGELLQGLRHQLEEQSLIDQLRQAVQDLPEPGHGAVRRYYEAHPEQFTTPRRLHVSLILLRVAPWAPETGWQAAQAEARRLIASLQQGADFATLARLHSADESAARGGDLGYVHAGMLSPEAQQVVDGLSPGEVSEPVRLLQGYAIFRVNDQVPPQLNDFARSEKRARQLLSREMKAQAWRRLLEDLREKTPITINEALLTGLE
ncbi:MAG: peptidylprolyl isomerase, partial [Gammaproteobacteria bacterium]